MKFIQWIFFILFAGIIIGMLTNLPIEKQQRAYIDFVRQHRNAPQKRIDDTMKYIDALENGETEYQNTAKNINAEHQNRNKITSAAPDKKYSKPLYIRDKNNPKILHKYTD